MFTELALFMPRFAFWRKAGQVSSPTDDNAAPLVMTVAEACKALRISSWSLNQLIRTQRLASIKIGSRRLIPVAAIREFVQAQAGEGHV